MQDWNSMDVDALRELYHKEAEELKASLLRGALWDEVREQRKQVTELSIALHKKVQETQQSNPAENGPDAGTGGQP